MMGKAAVKSAGCAMSTWTWLLLLSIIFISCLFDGVQLLESSRNVVEGGAEHPINDNGSMVHGGGGWGLPDSVAIIGKIFRYQLPTHDAACGNLMNYQVTVAGEENGDLPSWLTFNKTESSIEGVPRPDVQGQTHNVQVMATCTTGSTGGSPVPIKEYFTIKVVSDRDQSPEIDGQAPFEFKSSNRNDDVIVAPVRCETGGSVTTATVTIDADDSLLRAVDRLQLLRRLSAHLGLPETAVRLAAAAASAVDERPGFDDGVLVAGPGDTRHPTTAGLLVRWDVGCGNVFADQMPVLELLEVSSGNGTMRQAVGHPVVGWHVSSNKSDRRRLKRRVRFVDPTATPTPSAPRPSARPVPTAIVPETYSPETRIVPTTRTSVAGPEVTKSRLPTAFPSPFRPNESDTMKPTTPRLTKSPTPTYVNITPSRVASSETGTTPLSTKITVSMAMNETTTTPPSAYEDSIEPSVVTEADVSLRPTDVLPSWATSAFASDPVVPLTPVSATVTPPSTTPSKLPASKASRRPPKSTKPTTSRTTTTMQINEPPVVLRPLEVMKVFVGRQVSIKIPNDTFSDDGGAENLLLLLLHDGQTIPPSNWINFNETSNTLYGLASDEDIGTHNYELSALDEYSRVVKTACIVEVEADQTLHQASNEFSVTLDLEYEKVKYDLGTRLNLINKIATAFGDKDASKMQILRISRGSVVITYVNSTLPSEPCPRKEIEALLRRLLRPDGRINETFARAMEPYRVLKAEGGLAGPCVASTTSTASSSSTTQTLITTQTTTTMMMTSTTVLEVDVKPRVQETDNRLLIILLPILLFLVLLLAVVVICVLCYRRQRRRQKEEDKLTGLHKGIPIIFADELLEEKPDTPVSTLRSRVAPADDDGGRQSVPPPEYPTSKAGSRSSTLRSDYKSPLISDDEDDEEEESASPETLPRKSAARGAGDSASTTTPLLHYKD